MELLLCILDCWLGSPLKTSIGILGDPGLQRGIARSGIQKLQKIAGCRFSTGMTTKRRFINAI
jgi:hypothetical protein